MSFFLLILCCFSNVLLAFDDAAITEEGLQKHYIQSSDVEIANEGIFVNFEGDILNATAIFVDNVGMYIAGLGTCRVCHTPNDDLGRCQNSRCQNDGG